MWSVKICAALLVFVLCVIGNAQAVNKLADVYYQLPAEIKTIIDKYRDQSATINYDNFLFNLTQAIGYSYLKTELGITDDLTATSLQTLFEEYKMDIMTTTTVAPIKLADVYDKLPSDTKAVFNKYKYVDYDAVLSELKATQGYDYLKYKLMIRGELTAANLETLFKEYKNADTIKDNNAVRNGVTLGSVVMVSGISMLIAYSN